MVLIGKEEGRRGMYFPEDMTFQYFFFDTCPGYFLQALPVALLAGMIYGLLRRRWEPRLTWGQLGLRSLFVCYLGGLVVLTLLIRPLGILYYWLFYRADSGMTLRWFSFEYYLRPDTFYRMGGENIGNIAMYLPFGFLYPLSREGSNWRRTVLAGAAVSLTIELLQPIFGRSFDINDIILNTFGAAISATVLFGMRRLFRGSRKG